jgi:hypothetical protein
VEAKPSASKNWGHPQFAFKVLGLFAGVSPLLFGLRVFISEVLIKIGNFPFDIPYLQINKN